MNYLQWLIIPLCIALVVVFLRKKSPPRRLPPGPPPIPLLGNVLGIDTQYPWKTYARWGNQYGGIVYTRLLTQDIIVVNSEEVAKDLLDRRSHNYSSRPESIISATEFLGIDYSSIFLPYGKRLKLHRRFYHQAFHFTAALSFRPTQMRKVHDLIVRLVSTPHNFRQHLQLMTASSIMSIVYDYDVLSLNDPILVQLGRSTEIGLNMMRPEVCAILAAFPFLKYLPEWFPGAIFKRGAVISQIIVPWWVNPPFEHTKKKMEEGTAALCMVADVLSRVQDRAKTEAEAVYLEKEVKEACATALSAAAETTYSTLMVFLLAMILYPEVQARAQAEIDSVIGEGLMKLPQWEDRSSLPYVEAVIKEVLRWCPAAPLGIPHAAVDEDMYEGYYIPKGATIVVNAWAISQDPTRFPELQKFKPERFLQGKSQPIDEFSFTFGFGRRICAGRYLADASLWMSIVTLLAVFRFEASPSWDPGPDGVNVKWAAGLTTHPLELPCEIRLRNLSPEKLAQLIGLAAA